MSKAQILTSRRVSRRHSDRVTIDELSPCDVPPAVGAMRNPLAAGNVESPTAPHTQVSGHLSRRERH